MTTHGGRAASLRLAILACAAVLALPAASAATAPGARASSAPAACASEEIPVDVPVPARLAGTLCLPPGGSAVLQVLVPGATYTRSYWMWPGRSYAAAAISAGYATFALDRLDTGQSSQITPALVTSPPTPGACIRRSPG